MKDVWFYHLERQSLEAVIAVLLERARDRGWRAVVQAKSPERVAALDEALWTYSDDSFLAHGGSRDGDPDLQPVWLTTGDDNPNGAVLRVFVEGADAEPVLAQDGSLQRAIVIFDGRDADALTEARDQFRRLRDAGHGLSYWRQSGQGRWERQA